MKLTTFLFLLSGISVFAGNTYSQTKTLNLNMKNNTVKEVLQHIEEQSEFVFMYSDKLIDVNREILVNINNHKINDVLDELFAGTNVNYKLRDRFILLTTPEVFETDIMFMQQPAVSGTVTDEFGEPLPGVTVVVKGTTLGTVTNADGEYSLTNIPEDAILQFSFVGMLTKEIEVGSQTNIDVTMEVDAIGIEEVVAVGYGTMRRIDLTGSVVRVDIEQMAEMPNVSVIQAMQGAVAGLNVGAVDQAGENPTISIRGQNTLSSSTGANAPLIVLDGTIYRGSLIDLNTDDIESVDILKDASSAAIYGSQASNGVMLITTKKSMTAESKPIINYTGSYSLQTPNERSLEPMGAAELTKIITDAYWENGSRIGPDFLEEDPTFYVGDVLGSADAIEGFSKGLDNSMWDLVTKDGFINNHNLSIRGKTNNFGYYFSGGITDVEGYVLNDEYTKYNYRINLDAKINDWMQLGMETFLTSSDYSGVSFIGGNWSTSDVAFNIHPWTPIFDDEGKPLTLIGGTTLNPLLLSEIDDSDKRLNLFANIHADIKLPVKGLNYRVNFSQNYRTRNNDQFNQYAVNFLGSGFKNSSIGYDYTVDNILTYEYTFNDVHNINATLVYGAEKREGTFTNTSAQRFTNDLLGYHSLQQGDPTLRGLNTGKWQEQSLYSMARAVYNYNNKYLITGTVRRDGFSGFGTENKIGVFPSVALGWVASEESFIKGNVDWLNYLKIRGSFGQTGRRGVGRYDTRARVSSSPVIVFGDGASASTGQWISSMSNNELGWETTTGINIGLDFAIFNSRLHGNIEYYNNKTEDILYPIQIPNMTGFSSVNTNIGEVANHGIESALHATMIRTEHFSWQTSVNFSRNRNEIVSILGKDDDGIEQDLVENRLFIGEPTDVWYDYEITGIWQLDDRDAGIIPAGFFPGTHMVADLSGPDGEPDGVISPAHDRKIIGYRDPSYRMGIANTFNYKRFSLYAFINTIQGGKDYYYGIDALPFITKLERFSGQNWPSGGWDYWMPENPDARFRRLDEEGQYDPLRYMQRNFIRLQDVSLSYTFDRKLLTRLDISSLKVFISGKNLVTITKWRGWDPETGQGFETNGIPMMTSFTFGVNVEF